LAPRGLRVCLLLRKRAPHPATARRSSAAQEDDKRAANLLESFQAAQLT